MLAYRTLRQSAQRFIEPDCDTVQRLPFGLYLKCARDLDSLRNEVNALRMVRRYTSVPVPKPLDFVTAPAPAQDDPACGEGYLLMSRIPGVPLSRCHEVLSDKDAAQIEAQMQDHITQLRAIPQPTSTSHAICDTLGSACRDSRVRDGEPVGPFANEADFSLMLRDPDDSARSGHRIFFTHADLNPRNILVDSTVQRDGSLGWQVTGIVDWEMAGYYPEYWEYTKSLYERFRWTRRYQNMIHRVFRLFGDYSKEFDVELRSWEAGI
ncbi:putative nad-binding rossmann fold oxidoreductase family protein [Diaporthe ampelina]|uniref:Putative nad-binding rossmann fold oxidoreductase family protein n=1 Tax=Diaporthe ampelina TaxID=1214573 RepID=A0A0G2FYX8_9PEZI|nr:putative nad-binding rossmann fold oxidoreductase family protein [Diaporthe ampelina]